MIVTCKECGNRFRVDETKLTKEKTQFKCTSCGSIIEVTRPQPGEVKKITPDDFMPSPPSEKPRRGAGKEKPLIKGLSLNFKLTAILVLLVLASLSVVGYIASTRSRDALSEQAAGHLSMSANQKSKEYGLSFERINDEVLGVADYAKKTYERKDPLNDLGIRILMPWTGPQLRYNDPALHEKLRGEKLILNQIGLVLKSVVANNPYLSLGYIGTETKMTVFHDEGVVDIIEQLDEFDVTKRPWYVKAKETGELIWTEPYVDANTKKLCVTCAAPVSLSDNRLVGVIGFDVLLDTMQKDVIALDIGYDSSAFLVNSQGKVLVRPGMNPGDVRWDETYKTEDLLKTDNVEFNNIVAEMVKGRSGIGSFRVGEEGRYLAYAPLKAIGASMGIVASKDKVIKPAVTMQRFIIYVWGVVLLAAIAIGLIFGNTITKPINELTKMANLVSQGKMDLEPIPKKRKDEIGVLTESFNRLVTSLKIAMRRR